MRVILRQGNFSVGASPVARRHTERGFGAADTGFPSAAEGDAGGPMIQFKSAGVNPPDFKVLP